MFLTPRARAVLLGTLAGTALFASGWFGRGLLNSPAIPDSSPGIEAVETTTILPPKMHSVTLSDGTRIDSPDPIDVDITRSGAGRDYSGTGVAKSHGVETNAAEVATSGDFRSGTPYQPVAPGGRATGGAIAGGGGLSLKALGGGGAYLLIILGAIVFIAGPAGWILGKKIGIGISTVEAVIISLAGVGLIGMGMYPDLAPMLVVGLAGLAAAYGIFYVVKSHKVGKVSAEALAAARIVKVVDEADTGDGSAGDTIKKAVSASVGTGTELEKIIDRIVEKAGA